MVKNILPIILFLQFGTCTPHPPEMVMAYDGPFIDSIGCNAAKARLSAIDEMESDTLLSQALSVPTDSTNAASQSTFFQSLEESYQRYLKLFTPVKKASRSEISCPYDLVETFRLMVFDPQPFINAMLHTMSLTDLSTLDLTVQPKNGDTTLVHVALTKANAQEETRWLTFSEGELTLCMTRHGATLLTQKP